MSNMFGNGQGSVVQHQIMTLEQKAEIERIQGMQVRTQAANIAGMVLQHQCTPEARWAKFARTIELYIRGELPANSVVPPLRAGAEAD